MSILQRQVLHGVRQQVRRKVSDLQEGCCGAPESRFVSCLKRHGESVTMTCLIRAHVHRGPWARAAAACGRE